MLNISRSLTGTVKYVHSDDPAIDKDSPDYNPEKYAETRDLAHLPAKAGEKLTVFELKSLSMRQLQRITSMRALDGTWTTEQLCECVAHGLKGVSDIEVDGKPFSLEMEKGDERVKEKSLAKIFKLTLFRELGYQILAVSDLSF